MATIADAPTAEPTPIPAYAPADKLESEAEEVCDGAAVAEVGALVELGTGVGDVEAFADAIGGGSEKFPG